MVLDFAVLDLQSSIFTIQVNDLLCSAESISTDILNNAIAKASEYITLKVGDIVFVPFYVSESDLKENDTLSVLSDNEKICSVKIK
ncbi:MAG: hypothetical protein IPO21_03845 [Bacteroidales bacterium]|nr:hypothetical protein [Bacteroidales bacterium]